jgi:hypothetical protein
MANRLSLDRINHPATLAERQLVGEAGRRHACVRGRGGLYLGAPVKGEYEKVYRQSGARGEIRCWQREWVEQGPRHCAYDLYCKTIPGIHFSAIAGAPSLGLRQAITDFSDCFFRPPQLSERAAAMAREQWGL